MKHSLKLFAVACALPMVLTACGKNNSDASNKNPVDNAREAGKAPDAQGKIFRGDCSMKALDAIASGIATGGQASIKGARVQYQFNGANVTRATVMYTTTDCTGDAALTFRETAGINIQDQRTPDNGQFIDMNFDTLTLAIGSDAGLLVANDVGLCGLKDWAKGQERDVKNQSGQMDCYRKQLPYREANVFRIDNKNTLLWGSKGLLDRSEQRPTSVETGLKYVAQ